MKVKSKGRKKICGFTEQQCITEIVCNVKIEDANLRNCNKAKHCTRNANQVDVAVGAKQHC